ncbi:hypothetical protein [Bdellovibrio sp. BCCA]|uniref:hypothetical protein n=1 Tax=Bdellovibrio sp. BCCA TaxID=3136281 RepID=UPI0030F26848
MKAIFPIILLLSLPVQAKTDWPKLFNEVIIPCAAGVIVADVLVKEEGDTKGAARILMCGIITGTAQHPSSSSYGSSGKSRSELERQLDEWERTPALQNLMPPKN